MQASLPTETVRESARPADVPPAPPRTIPAVLRRHLTGEAGFWLALPLLACAAWVAAFVFAPAGPGTVAVALLWLPFVTLAMVGGPIRELRRNRRRLHALRFGQVTSGTVTRVRLDRGYTRVEFSYVGLHGEPCRGEEHCKDLPPPEIVPNAGVWVTYLPARKGYCAIWPPLEYAAANFRRALTEQRIQQIAAAEPRASFANLYPGEQQGHADVVRLDCVDGRWHACDAEGRWALATGVYDFVCVHGRILALRAVFGMGSPPGHLTLSQGNRVEYAGQVSFSSDRGSEGIVLEWGNRSGHYRPAAHFAHVAPFPADRFRACIDGGSKKGRRVQLPVFYP